ncbi:MAG: hypothetical protein JXA64_03110 [Candidatus Fermentibacteraceae bacterium]|nr:hypothetical protein [Candidatus Fermentibacteraceae bacterium]MBN2608080.1 hypothetical protein [Candidatus Fermentibacteraceae bacterium]
MIDLKGAAFLLVAIAAGCGGKVSESASDTFEVTIPDGSAVALIVRDSIGIAEGDSDYVMGGVEGAAFGPDGNIAVLDCARGTVRIYSPRGEFLRSVGRRGSGPGELGNVTSMAVTESGSIQLAGAGGDEYGIHSFDYFTGEWISSIRTFVPPSCLEAAWGDRYLRKDISFEVRGDEIYLPVTVSLYEAGMEEPCIVFHSDTVLFDPTKEVELLELDWYGYDIAADRGGTVYIAPRSTHEAEVMVFDSSGCRLRTLVLPYEPVERTSDELEMERNILRAKAIASNESPEGLEPDPFKPTIRGLEVDGDGNLWILQGGPSTPTFSVVSPEGDFLYTAVVEGDPSDGSTWRFHIGEEGMLAYAEDPLCGYQKIYLLDR